METARDWKNSVSNPFHGLKKPENETITPCRDHFFDCCYGCLACVLCPEEKREKERGEVWGLFGLTLEGRNGYVFTLSPADDYEVLKNKIFLFGGDEKFSSASSSFSFSISQQHWLHASNFLPSFSSCQSSLWYVAFFPLSAPRTKLFGLRGAAYFS